MKVLVTGGTGFVGSAIISALRTAHPDWHITNLDVRPPPASSTTPYTHADVSSAPSVLSAITHLAPDAVIHTAGLVPSGPARYHPTAPQRARVAAVNEAGAANVVAACRAAAVRALVYTSSFTVVTDDQARDWPLMREDATTSARPTLLYGQSKAAAEALVLGADGDALATCALRPATVIGAGDAFGVVRAVFACVANGETPYVVGDGHNLYDFVHVANVADAHVLAVENLLGGSKTARGLAFFVSNHEPVYFRAFMEAVWAQCGGHVAPFRVSVPAWLAWWAGWAAEWTSWASGREAALSRGSVMDAIGIRYCDNSRAIEILGYRPRVGLADAVRDACEDFKRQAMETRDEKVAEGSA